MRIYFDEEFDSVVVQGTRQLWPPKSLQVVSQGNTIEVWLKGELRRIVGPVPFVNIQDASGSTFSSVTETVAYLTETFDRGDKDLELSTANW